MDERFKISYPFRPYFYIATLDGFEFQVSSYLSKKYGAQTAVEHMDREDLDLKDHLSGLKKTYIKLSFTSTVELIKIRKELMPLVRKNTDRIKKESAYADYLARNLSGKGGDSKDQQLNGDILNQIVDIREYDVPFHMRVSIDEKIFVGLWLESSFSSFLNSKFINFQVRCERNWPEPCSNNKAKRFALVPRKAESSRL